MPYDEIQQVIKLCLNTKMLIWVILGSFVAFLFYVMQAIVAFSLIFVVVGGLMSLVYFNQNKLLYMPVIPNMPLSPSQNPYPYRHPSQQGMNTTDLELVTSDGLKIRGWHVKKENAKQVIIYFHQNAGSTHWLIQKRYRVQNPPHQITQHYLGSISWIF